MNKSKKDFYSNKANGDPKKIFGEPLVGITNPVQRTGGRFDDIYLESDHDDSTNAIPEKHLGLHIRLSRWQIVLATIIFIMLGIASKAWWLQITHGSNFRILAEDNRVQLTPIQPTRGKIYDRNGIVLADNVPLYQLILSKTEWAKTESIEKAEIKSRLMTARIFLDDAYIDSFNENEVILQELTYKEALALRTMTRTMRAVDVKITSRRNYRDPDIYAHVLGYVGRMSPEEYSNNKETYLISDVIGKVGLEKQYEQELRGVLGKKSIEVNAFGKEVHVVSQQEPIRGNDIYTTLDARIQESLFEFIKSQTTLLQKGRAAAVILDPRSGEVLAIVSYPGYNNQSFYQGIDTAEYQSLLENENQPLFNRAINGQYPPGSTFKLIVASAGLEDKIITPQTTVYSSGGIQVSRWFFPDWRSGGHGYTNLYKAISESVNTYFYILGGGYEDRIGLGVSRIKEQAEKFGLGRSTGIDLPDEASGFLPTPDWKIETKDERWYIGDTYNLSIGQGDLLVTPLQMANVISTISNGGTLYTPHFIKNIVTTEERTKKDEKTWLQAETIMSKKIMEELRRGLRETVRTGSGIRLLSAPITSAGKTGTAEWSNTKDPHGWYIGFAPYENPEIAFAIIVEEGIGGNTASVPIAHAFLNWYGTEYK